MLHQQYAINIIAQHEMAKGVEQQRNVIVLTSFSVLWFGKGSGYTRLALGGTTMIHSIFNLFLHHQITKYSLFSQCWTGFSEISTGIFTMKCRKQLRS